MSPKRIPTALLQPPTPATEPLPPTPATVLRRTPLRLLSMVQVSDLTTTEARSERVLIEYRWPWGRVLCPHPDCGSADVRECRSYKHSEPTPVQFVCRTCGKRFTVRTAYFLAGSSLPFQTWVWALYIVLATPEQEPPTAASLVRDLGVAEGTAGYLVSRLREHIQGIGRGPGRPRPYRETPTQKGGGRPMLPAPSGPTKPSQSPGEPPNEQCVW